MFFETSVGPSEPLQRIGRASRQAVASPLRLNRREVTVPYRVLSDNEVAGLLGYLLPVQSWRSLNAQLRRYSSRCPGSRKRLLKRSSPGVRPSYTVFPDVPALGLSAMGTSLGVSRPYSASGGRNPRLAGCPVELPGFAGRLPAGPTQPTTVPLAGFLNLSAAWSSFRRPAIFRQVALLGFSPTGDRISARSPGRSS
jgi:hypothetical protein